MNRITINGKEFAAGKSIHIAGNRVMVDGKDVTPDAKDIRIEVTGNVGSICADSCHSISVSGSVSGDVATLSGDVKCGDVGGLVKTMSGDVKCGSVQGGVKTTSGDVSHR